MSTPLHVARENLRRYHHADGVPELLAGAAGVLLGTNIVLQGLFGDSMVASGLSVVISLVLCAFVFAQKRLEGAIRARFTYPRLGYVHIGAATEMTPEHRRRANIILAVVAIWPIVIAGLFVVYRSAAGSWTRWIPLLAGSVMAAFLVRDGARHDYARRNLVIAPVIAIWGGIVAFLDAHWLTGVGVYLLGMSLIIFAAGGVTLWRFVRSTPVALPE
jgi:hypothetical protein